ncbi:MAG: lipopolysaccharide biosynthesis protein [Pirellulaceae bacterium]|nr:lipopolysaccharide biosynthesis protein [Pirellulaceae bacterium]
MTLLATPTSAGKLPRLARGAWRVLARLANDSLLQKSVLSIFDQAVVSGTSFLTSVVLGRLVTKEDLGVYYLAISIVFFVRGIQEQLVSAPYMIYSSRREGAALQRFAGSALVHECVVVLAACAVLTAAALLHLLPAGLDGAAGILIGSLPLLLLRDFIRQMSFADLNMRAAIALDVTVATLQLGGIAMLASRGWLTVGLTFGILALSCAVPVAVWLLVRGRRMLFGWHSAVADFRHNWPFARWALATQLLACTTPYLMPWVVALTHSEAETGTLGACTTLVGLANMVMMGLCNFLGPKATRAFSAGGVAALWSVLTKAAMLFTSTLGLICLAGFIFGEQLTTWVYGEQFAGTGLLVGVLSLSVLANSLGVMAGNGLWAMERPSANFVADLLSLLVTIVATVTLVPLWGPLGAALATLAGTVSDAILRVLVLRRTMREVSLAAGGAP